MASTSTLPPRQVTPFLASSWHHDDDGALDARFDDLDATYCVLSSGPLSQSTQTSAHFARPERATKVDLQDVFVRREREAQERLVREREYEWAREEQATRQKATEADESRRKVEETLAQVDREKAALKGRKKAHGRLRSIFGPSTPRARSTTSSLDSPTSDHPSSPVHSNKSSTSSLRTSLPRSPRATAVRSSILGLAISSPVEVTKSTRPALVPTYSTASSDAELIISARVPDEVTATSHSQARPSTTSHTLSSTTSITFLSTPSEFSSTSNNSRPTTSPKPKPAAWLSRPPVTSASIPALSNYAQSPSESNLSLLSNKKTPESYSNSRRVLETSYPSRPAPMPTFDHPRNRDHRRRPSVPEAAFKAILALGRRTSTKQSAMPITPTDEELQSWRRPRASVDAEMEVLGSSDDDVKAGVRRESEPGGTTTISLGRVLHDEVLIIESPTPSSPARSLERNRNVDVPPPASTLELALNDFRFPAPTSQELALNSIPLADEDSDDITANFIAVDRYLSSPEPSESLPPSPPPEHQTQLDNLSAPFYQSPFSRKPSMALLVHTDSPGSDTERSGLMPPPRPRVPRTGSQSPSTSPALSSSSTFAPVNGESSLSSSTSSAHHTERRLITDEAWRSISLSSSPQKLRKAASRKNLPQIERMRSFPRTAEEDEGKLGDVARAARERERRTGPLTPPPSPPTTSNF
ncbi:hypothetical protein P7C70_g4415, partial [Phenoliferia sp. Uapishka_3]